MFRFGAASFLLLCAAQLLHGHEPITTKITWSKEIVRIVRGNCSSCHREAGTAMPLDTFEQARPWAAAIKEQVLSRQMPPGGLIPGFEDFMNRAGLTQQELALIADWVEGGAPEGDRRFLPSGLAESQQQRIVTPKFQTGARIETAATLKASVTLIGIEPHVAEGGHDLRYVASLPDGRVVPLIWVYGQAKFAEERYWLRTPLTLPEGTRIERWHSEAGSITPLFRPNF